MNTILVTGGTSGPGHPTVSALRAAGHTVRALSRHAGEGRVVGDLSKGTGLDAALDGVDTVVHLATNRRKDAGLTRNLLAAALEADVSHLVYISIVGVDKIPYSYYRDKLENERMIGVSGIPFTILRATQFHSFVGEFLQLQRRLPVLFSLDVPVQSIEVGEVAVRLAELAGGPPQGRVADIGGPEIHQVGELAELWQGAFGIHKPIRTLPIGGKAIAAFKAGHHTTGLPGYGAVTFAEYARAEASK